MDEIFEIFLAVAVLIFASIILVLAWDGGHWLWEIPRRSESKIEALTNLNVNYFLLPEDFRKIPGLSKFENTKKEKINFTIGTDGTIALFAPQEIVNLKVKEERLKIESVSVPEFKKASSFLIQKNGTVLAIKGQYLYYLSKKKSRKPVRLPSSNMNLSRSNAGAVFVFGGNSAHSKRVYKLNSRNRLRFLGSLPDKVTAVTGYSRNVYASTASGLYKISRRNVSKIVKFTDNDNPSRYSNVIDKITSIACASDGSYLYFATKNTVYAFKDWSGIALVKEIGGELCTVNDDLFIWDSKRSLLVSIPDLSNTLKNSKISIEKQISQSKAYSY